MIFGGKGGEGVRIAVLIVSGSRSQHSMHASIYFTLLLQEAAEQRAAEAKRKHEEMMARRFADEMGMGGVGNNTGMLGVAATRIKSKVQGKKVGLEGFL